MRTVIAIALGAALGPAALRRPNTRSTGMPRRSSRCWSRTSPRRSTARRRGSPCSRSRTGRRASPRRTATPGGLRARAGGRTRSPAEGQPLRKLRPAHVLRATMRSTPSRGTRARRRIRGSSPSSSTRGRQGIGDPGEHQALSPARPGNDDARPAFGMAGGCRGAIGGRVLILAPDDSAFSGRLCLVGLVYQGPGRADLGLLAAANGD